MMESTRRLAVVSVLVVAVLMLTLQIPSVFGAQFTVTSLNATGAGSITEAVSQALATTDTSSTITFASGLSGTVTLSSQLSISNNKTILVDGGGDITLSGQGITRIFNVSGGSRLTLVDIDLEDGFAAGNGGAISSSGILFLDNVTISNSSSGGNGGAVYANNLLTAASVTLENNDAVAGGGVYVDTAGTISMLDSSVRSNTLTGSGTGRFGAGIVAMNGGTLNNVTVTGNSGAVQGGGIYAGGGTLVITRFSNISGNSATQDPSGEYGSGGGIYVNTIGKVEISHSLISVNSAHRGGGIFNDGVSYLVNSTISNNSASDSGTLAEEGGGAVFVADGDLVTSFVTIANNSSVNSSSAGVFVETGAVFELRSTLMQNSGDNNCEVNGTLVDSGFNLDSGSTCAFTLVNSLNSTDPQIGGLSSGVHPLADTSPAVDVVTDCRNLGSAPTYFLTTNNTKDQLTPDATIAYRPQGAACDIGAYELPEPLPPAVTVRSFGGTVFEEGETFIEYEIVLNAQPADDVVIDVAAGNPAQLTVEALDGTQKLTFDTINWLIPQRVRVYAVDDAIAELDPHTSIVLNSVNGTDTLDPAYIGVNVANLTITIRDNDAPYGRTVSIVEDLAVAEGNLVSGGVFNFVVKLSVPVQAGDAPVVVSYRTVDFTATVADKDYVPASGSLVFVAGGPDEQTIQLKAVADPWGEFDEIFRLQLVSAQNASLLNNFANATILNDDLIPSIQVSPSNAPDGAIGEEYTLTFTASGGSAPYTWQLQGELPDGLEFDDETATISGIPEEEGEFNFYVYARDKNLQLGFNNYRLTIRFGTLATPDATQQALQTQQALSDVDIESTRVAVVRDTLGPPVAYIDPDADIEGLSIRTGPMIGASLINIARPDVEYPVLGSFKVPGSQFTWYLIEFPLRRDAALSDEEQPKGRGWISGRYALIKGFIADIDVAFNPFDAVSYSETGVTGRSLLKNNIYFYPSPSSQLISRFDEGTTFQILGRTVIDLRNDTYWILVRIDRTGQVGWTRYTPYVKIFGDVSIVPKY